MTFRKILFQKESRWRKPEALPENLIDPCRSRLYDQKGAVFCSLQKVFNIPPDGMCSNPWLSANLQFQVLFFLETRNREGGTFTNVVGMVTDGSGTAYIQINEEGKRMIEVSHLTKRYGDHTAVDDLSFQVEKGSIFGFLGPNGAGKTTTMNIMTGCLAASEGEIRIGGYEIFEQSMEARRLIGYLPEQPPLYADRTPAEYLRFVGEARKLSRPELRTEIARVMEMTKITDMSDRLIRNLSKGYRQRVGIAQALLGNPEVVILDEPTVGLDPRQITEIRELIHSLGREHTVILSSHILPEVQAVCDRVLILSRGRLAACDTPDRLEAMFSGADTVELTVDATEAEARQILSPLTIQSLEVFPQESGLSGLRIQATDKSQDLRRELFFLFASAGKPILQMNTLHASLEEVFLELTAEAEKEAESEQKVAHASGKAPNADEEVEQ